MIQNRKLFTFGLLSWMIPFFISIPFYSPEGTPLIDLALFKSIMIVTGSGVGSVLLILYFRNVPNNYFRAGLTAGIVWLLMNWILDLIILVPMSHLSIPEYAGQIGLRYLMILFMGVTTGYIVEESVRRAGEGKNQ